MSDDFTTPDSDREWFEDHPGRLHYLRFATKEEETLIGPGRPRHAVLVRKGNGGRFRIFDPPVLPDDVFRPWSQDENYLGAVFDCWWFIHNERNPEHAKGIAATLFDGGSPLTGCSHPDAPMAVINGNATRPSMGVPEKGYENYSRRRKF